MKGEAISSKRWRTKDELMFIKKLPLDKLESYFQVLHLRKDWGKIDCIRVLMAIDYLQSRL